MFLSCVHTLLRIMVATLLWCLLVGSVYVLHTAVLGHPPTRGPEGSLHRWLTFGFYMLVAALAFWPVHLFLRRTR